MPAKTKPVKVSKITASAGPCVCAALSAQYVIQRPRNGRHFLDCPQSVEQDRKVTTERTGFSSEKLTLKRAFVRTLAEYLAGDQAIKSIMLQMGKPDAQQWARLRATTPLFGYPTVDDAEKQLAEWLGVG